MNKLAPTLTPVFAALVLGACSTSPTMPENAWKIAPVQTVRHGGTNAAAGYFALGRYMDGGGANEQAVAVCQADGAPKAARDVRRCDRDPEARALRGLAAAQRVHPIAQGGVRRQGKVEAFAEAVRVDAEQATRPVKERATR